MAEQTAPANDAANDEMVTAPSKHSAAPQQIKKIKPKYKINEISGSVVAEVLGAGLRDFQAAPIYGLAFGGFYAIGGWLLYYLLAAYDVPFLVYPTAMGFALIAPFVAAGLYDVSRRLEADEPLSWGAVLGSVRRQGGRELGWMAIVTLFSFIIWIDIAVFLYLMFFGLQPVDMANLVSTMVSTPTGILFFIVGNAVGAVLGLSVFAITAVSFPLLMDREVDFVTAMITSAKCVIENPGPMIGWGFVIAFLLVCSLLSMMLGMFVVLPVLGHATWHLYRRLIPVEETDNSNSQD